MNAVNSFVVILIARRNAHINTGMILLEAAKPRQKPETGNPHRASYGDRLAFTIDADSADRVLQLLHGTVCASKELLSFGSEGDRTMSTGQQPDSHNYADGLFGTLTPTADQLNAEDHQ